MIHLSSYHSNGLPTVVWSNKVNLIGEKVYKPKIHFCEYCNKPILIYGRLIPCKHVFCFTCSTLCLIQQQPPLPPPLPPPPPPPTHQTNSSNNGEITLAPLLPGPNEPDFESPSTHHQSPRNNHNNYNGNNSNYLQNDGREQRLLPMAPQARVQTTNGNNNHNNNNTNNNDTKTFELNRSDSNHSLSHRDSYSGSVIMDESTSNTTPNTAQFDVLNSPNLSNSIQSPLRAGLGPMNGPVIGKGCHRCGNRVLRVERNTLNSIFVCQIDNCRRTYLSARDLQAHFNHRHSRNRGNHHQGHATGASVAAISSSPYISSSSLLHLNITNGNQANPSTSKSNDNCSTNNSNRASPPPPPPSSGPNQNSGSINHRHPPSHRRRNRKNSSSANQNQQQHPNTNPDRSNQQQQQQQQQHSDQRNRDRMKREGDRFKERERDHYQKERERERNSKEYHRQSLQRAAQWAEASAQIMEKGLTR